uniref:NECAP PHear domain-containing protein n=1 Tax=Setaria digitata TaxID=48799 RepID=A0A915PYX5_9BILA
MTSTVRHLSINNTDGQHKTPQSTSRDFATDSGVTRPGHIAIGTALMERVLLMTEEYESVCLVKPEVFAYRIPPLTSNRGHKAADWKLNEPDWTGRMRLVAIGNKLELRLEDKVSGELFAKCPVDEYPGLSIEPVLDSSRYFVVRLKNDNGQTAFIGLGFADRSDSFDLNVALQEHFKYIEKSAEFSKEQQQGDQPKLDLGFKKGETITINFGKKTSTNPQQTKVTPSNTSSNPGSFPLLPPPPSAVSPVSQRSRNSPGNRADFKS